MLLGTKHTHKPCNVNGSIFDTRHPRTPVGKMASGTYYG